MKQANLLNPNVANSQAGRSTFRTVFYIVLSAIAIAAIVVTAILIVSSADRTASASYATFQEANPEVRFSPYADAGDAQMSEAQYLAENPETRAAHLSPGELAASSVKAFLIFNPEARQAVSEGETAEVEYGDFFEANPELTYNQRYMDAGGSK